MSEERHLIQLNPSITKQYIDNKVEGSPTDNTGSQPGRRYGTLRGCPSITRITFDRYKRQNINTIAVGTTQNIYVEGYNMYYTSNIYLSGSDPDMFQLPSQSFSYFEDNFTNRIATENPAFTAVPLSGWTIINQTNMYFEIPSPLMVGTIDIVLQGPAGYTVSSNSGSEYTNYYITVTE
jgi:hypothetical protein